MEKPPNKGFFTREDKWLDQFCDFLRANWDTPSIPVEEILQRTGLDRIDLPVGKVPFYYKFMVDQTYNLVWSTPKED